MWRSKDTDVRQQWKLTKAVQGEACSLGLNCPRLPPCSLCLSIRLFLFLFYFICWGPSSQAFNRRFVWREGRGIISFSEGHCPRDMVLDMYCKLGWGYQAWKHFFRQFLPISLMIFIIFCMYECFAHMYICVLHSCSVHRNHKRAMSPLELELLTVVSCHVGARIWTQVLWKTGNILNHWAISLSLPQTLMCHSDVFYCEGFGTSMLWPKFRPSRQCPGCWEKLLALRLGLFMCYLFYGPLIQNLNPLERLYSPFHLFVTSRKGFFLSESQGQMDFLLEIVSNFMVLPYGFEIPHSCHGCSQL